MDETLTPQSQADAPKQKSLSEILDEIEQRHIPQCACTPRERDSGHRTDCNADAVNNDVLALVKALRRAVKTLDKATYPGVFKLGERCQMALYDITQLLIEHTRREVGEETKTDLGGKEP